MSKKSWPVVPVDKAGNILSYPMWDAKMVDVEPFLDTATFLHFTRGRSSALAIFRRTGGSTFPMFLSDLQDALIHLDRGELRGWFRFVKKGANYGVAYTP